MNEIVRTYETYASKCSQEAIFLRKKSNYYVIGKLISFILFLYILYITYKTPHYYTIAISVILFMIYIALVVLDNHCINKIDRLKRKITICRNELNALKGDFSPFRSGDRFVDPEHEYTFDLDIFGKNALFNRLNRTITEKGETALSNKFIHLCQDEEEIKKNSEAIAELKQMVDWRISFLAKDFVPYNLLEVEVIQRNDNFITKSILPYISVLLTLVLFILGVVNYISLVPFAIMFFLQLSIGLFSSKRLTYHGVKAERLQKEYQGYFYILKMLYHQNFSSEKINAIKNKLFSNKHNSQKAFYQLSKILNLIDQRNSPILFILLNGFFLYDLMLIRQIKSWNIKYYEYLDVWIDQIAEFDALLSLSIYAFNNPENVNAQIQNQTNLILNTEDIFHPFLANGKAIKNNFSLYRGDIAIVTGANMAGKSTFLRTIGVNYILACCGAPVCAKSFTFSIVTLFSSMRTTDNLSKDISYFNAELIRIEKLIRHVKTHHYTLIILDEIFKGTNSKDKLEGSVMFLHEISKYNVSGIVATHDLELSKLEMEENESKFINFCFEIELSDEIKYSYKIRKGVAQNLNASYLLSNIINKLK